MPIFDIFMKLVACFLICFFVYLPQASGECSDRFCIGIILPLSHFAEYGLAVKNGIELAKSTGSIKFKGLEFKFEDSAFDAKRTIASFKKLAEIDKANLIYVLGGPMSEVVAPIADRYRLPTLVSSNDPTTAIRHSYVIRFANPAKDYGERLAKEVLARSFKHTAVLITENQYLNSLLEALQKSAKDIGNIKVVHRGTGEMADFRSAITRIKVEKFDSIAVFLYPGQISQFYRQLREQQLSLPTFGSDAFESNSEITASGSGIEGAFFANNGVTENFRTLYIKHIGNDFQLAFAALGFDLATFLSEQFENSDKHLSPEETLRKLSQPSEFDGISGRIQVVRDVSGDKYFRFPVRIRKVLNGKVITVG